LVIGEDVPHVDDALALQKLLVNPEDKRMARPVSSCDLKAMWESPSAESLSAVFLFMNNMC